MKIITQNTQYTDIMSPGSLIGSVLMASGIKNSLIIFHGVSGCHIEAVHFRSDQIPAGSYTPIIPTGINESDCINGGTEKLFEVLRNSINRAVSRNRPPEIVFIVTSDATSIVGDDIKSAAKLVEKETGIKIVAMDTPGFAGGLVHGTDCALSELLQKFELSKPSTEIKTKINLIAPHLTGSKNWTNDTDEIIRLLNESEIEVNLNLCRNFELKNITNFNEAKFNYIFSSEKLEKFEKICSDLNSDIITDNLPLPVGIANTEEWLLKIAEKFDKTEEARAVLIKDQGFVQTQLKLNYNFSWMSTLMYGKRCGILANAKFGASLARCMLWDFGIIPKVIGLTAETDNAANKAIGLLKEIENQAEFTVLINPSYLEYVNHLKQAQVDFAIGSIQDKPLCLGNKIPHLSLSGFNFFNQYNFIPYPNFGIRGILGLLSELSGLMEDAFYLKDIISDNNYEPKENQI